MATKRKISTITLDAEQASDPADELMFLCLGGGNEVGRSCHIIQYKGKTVMVCLYYLLGRSLGLIDSHGGCSLMRVSILHSMV